MIYTKDEKEVDRALRSAHFKDLDKIGRAYELESRKPRILISAAAADVCFVVFHFFGHASHELTTRVNLQHLRPCQRTASVNRLESLRNLSTVFRGQRLRFFVMAGNIDNSQCIFVNLPSTRKLVMG